MRNNWKEGYYNGVSEISRPTKYKIYYSLVGDTFVTDGKSISSVGTKVFKADVNHILPGGKYKIYDVFIDASGGNNASLAFSGQGLDVSFVDWDVYCPISANWAAQSRVILEDQTILNMNDPAYYHQFYNRCRIMKDAVSNPERSAYCIIYNSSNIKIDLLFPRHNSYIQINHTADHKDLSRPHSLFSDSTIEITQQVLKDFKGYYHGFDDCKFKIGDGEAVKLVGTTEEELRSNFVQRCNDAGITITAEEMKYWVFANGASTDGKILKGSILAKFIERQHLQEGLGAFNYFVESIPIVAEGAVTPNSIGATRGKSMRSDGKSLLIDTAFKTDRMDEAHITSNVISFRGVKEFSKLNILDNIPNGVGVSLNAQHPIEGEGVSVKKVIEGTATLKPNERYLLRPNLEDGATAEYAAIKIKNQDFNSSLGERKNVVLTGDSVLPQDFIITAGDPMLYLVPNAETYQAYEIRIVDEIMGEARKSGNLEKGYWYIVEPDSSEDETGTVQIGSKNYPCYGSFLATDTASFKAIGACSLKKCFADDDQKVETFFEGKQKPKWFSVLGDDMRAIRKNSSMYENELQLGFDGRYIGSGHPQFYEMVNGHSGIKAVGMPIKGKYFQVRVKVTSLNIM